MKSTVERKRITGPDADQWRQWGNYISARSWGTVREGHGSENAWEATPFEYARSRAFRWAEDGIAGFCDLQQRLCMTAAFWNGQDPWLKERFFGLSNEQGNHGEDVKEYFFFIDGIPSQSYMKMMYRYPHVEYPYDRLVRENAVRGQDEPPYALADALQPVFEERRYFDIVIEYAKAGPDDILCRITAVNQGEESAPLHILPHLFFRNTWRDRTGRQSKQSRRPQLRAGDDGTVTIHHPDFNGWRWYTDAPSDLLFTENETNTELLSDTPNSEPYTKDGIDYAVVRGQPERVNPDRAGSKCAAHWQKELKAGETWIVQTRLSAASHDQPFADFDAVFEQRQRDTDEFYAALQPESMTPEEKTIQRAAYAGLMWNKSFYHFSVKDWLKENADRLAESDQKAFEDWKHFDAHDILSVPDPWEYPWLATWDVDFQVVTISMVDPEFAKEQALLLLSDRYMHPDGAMPGFEGDLGAVHPPIHAWAVWHIYHTTEQDQDFLQQAYTRLKLHFDWWMENHQPEKYLFDGGFLGKDNISLLDRNTDIPEGGWITQVDGTGWMALFVLNMLAMAIELDQDRDAESYFGHFLKIRAALQKLWDEQDQFFYEVVRMPNRKRIPLKVRSFSGLIPLVAAMLLDPATLDGLPRLRAQFEKAAKKEKEFRPGGNGCVLLAVLPHDQIRHLLQVMFDPDEFYTPYGLRALSKVHEQEPMRVQIGEKELDLQYEPGESTSKMFGGNSNWRGPIWAPLNKVAIEALHIYDEYFSEPLIQHKGDTITSEQAALHLIDGLTGLFKLDAKDRRPYLGKRGLFQQDPLWRDSLWFSEFFHAETGAGLGASHQNGWTALIANLMQDKGRAVYVPKTHGSR